MVNMKELRHYIPGLGRRQLPDLRFIWTSSIKPCLPDHVVLLDFCALEEDDLQPSEDVFSTSRLTWYLDLWNVESNQVFQLILDSSSFDPSRNLVTDLERRLGEIAVPLEEAL
jgi:hypothetical protein